MSLSVSLVLLANTGVFLFHQRPLTAWGLRANDAALESKIAFLKERNASSKVLALYYESSKQMQYYMPDGPSQVWVDVKTAAVQETALPEGTQEIVAMDESLVHAAEAIPGEEVRLGDLARVKIMPVGEAKRVRYVAPYLIIE